MSLVLAKRRSCISHNVTSVLAVLVFAFGSAMDAAAGQNVNRRVIPSHAQPYGMTYGEWSAEWWTWVVGIPAGDSFDENPMLDVTGEFGDIDQEGPVFFLAASFGGTVERTLTIPTGKGLFFPIVNSLWWAPDARSPNSQQTYFLGWIRRKLPTKNSSESQPTLIKALTSWK